MENKLPKEFKDKWVEALRSGKFLQGDGQLCFGEDQKYYCCLGVACAISNPDIEPPHEEFITSGIHENLFPNVPTLLVGEDNIPRELANMNDGVKVDGKVLTPKHSFNEIADWIENNL